jgi:1,4-alpha-glucan branching enzyme
LNKILKQISNTEIRKRKIKKESSEKAKPKAKKIRFNLYAPEAEKVFLKGDFDNWDVDNLPMKFVHLRMLTHRKQLAPKGIPVLIILVFKQRQYVPLTAT